MQLDIIEEKRIKRQRIGKKIRDIIFYSILGFIIACILSFIITGKITGKPNFLGYRHFYIASESMEPVIKANQFVLSKVIEPNEIKENDIIAYYNKDLNKIIIHRVINIRKNKEGELLFTFKGDNNHEPDPYDVTEDMIMYEVIKY